MLTTVQDVQAAAEDNATASLDVAGFSPVLLPADEASLREHSKELTFRQAIVIRAARSRTTQEDAEQDIQLWLWANNSDSYQDAVNALGSRPVAPGEERNAPCATVALIAQLRAGRGKDGESLYDEAISPDQVAELDEVKEETQRQLIGRRVKPQDAEKLALDCGRVLYERLTSGRAPANPNGYGAIRLGDLTELGHKENEARKAAKIASGMLKWAWTRQQEANEVNALAEEAAPLFDAAIARVAHIVELWETQRRLAKLIEVIEARLPIGGTVDAGQIANAQIKIEQANNNASATIAPHFTPPKPEPRSADRYSEHYIG